MVSPLALVRSRRVVAVTRFELETSHKIKEADLRTIRGPAQETSISGSRRHRARPRPVGVDRHDPGGLLRTQVEETARAEPNPLPVRDHCKPMTVRPSW